MACSWIFSCVKPKTHTWWSSQDLGGDLGCDHPFMPHSLSFNKPTPLGLVNLYQRELSWVRAPKKQLCNLPSTTAHRAPQQPVKRFSVPLLQRSLLSDKDSTANETQAPSPGVMLSSVQKNSMFSVENKIRGKLVPTNLYNATSHWVPA